MTERARPAQRSSPGALRLKLEIDNDAPLEGSMSAGDGTTRSFAGWPGLASTLTAFLADWEHDPPAHADDA